MKEAIDPQFPLPGPRSVEALMDLAVTMEAEAARRFTELATLMAREGNHDTAALFRELAADEQAHGDAVTRWAGREGLRPPVAVEVGWRLPETFELEAASGDFFISPYEALGLALENEERTFSFYAHMAAAAETEAARERAEALARGELEHITRLRQRRRAIRHTDRPRQRVPRATDVAGLQALADILESAWAASAQTDAAMLDNAGHAAPASLLRRLCAAARDCTPAAGASTGNAAGTGQQAAVGGTPDVRLRALLLQAEHILQAYMDAADQTEDEALMLAAQALSEHALARVSQLGACLGQYS